LGVALNSHVRPCVQVRSGLVQAISAVPRIGASNNLK
jgi:hypothetical protein